MQSDPLKCIHVSVPSDPALEMFLYHVALETLRARELFPRNQQQLAAATEEHGELAQALLDHSRGEVPAQAVWEEGVQAAAMAARTVIEGSMEFPDYRMPDDPQSAGTLKAALDSEAKRTYEQWTATIKAVYLPWDNLSKKRKAMWRAIVAVEREALVECLKVA